jgi:hypothetical protein
MIDYIENMLSELPADMDRESVKLAPNHLFEVNTQKPETMLDKSQSEMFHHNVAKLLFLCKPTRPDVQTVVAFFVNQGEGTGHRRLQKFDTGHEIPTQHIEHATNSSSGKNMSVMKWWVDASIAVHPDMQSFTGGALSMGRGAVYGTSTRQKLTEQAPQRLK